MNNPANFLIFSDSEDGWWSNEDGWGERSSATRFNYDEMTTLHRPLTSANDSQWILEA